MRRRPTLPADLPEGGGPHGGVDVATLVAWSVSGMWAVGAVTAFLVLSTVEARTGWSASVPPWLPLVAVPVAVAASGRGAGNLLLLLAATVALGFEHLEQAAFALDVRPLVLVALAVAGTLGAYSRRPAARGLRSALG